MERSELPLIEISGLLSYNFYKTSSYNLYILRQGGQGGDWNI